MKYDFSGWATKNNLKCSDGRTILKDAFKENDGQKVPLVWNHQHDDPDNVLGHALLENRDEGVYAYCAFNDTESGQQAKKLVEHGDVVSLSIYANKLKQQGGNVIHGAIREVSLVLAGANPGAFIDAVMSHGEDSEGDGIISMMEDISLSEGEIEENTVSHAEENKEDKKVAENSKDMTIKEIIDTMTEDQKNAMYYLIGKAIEGDDENDKGGDENMKHNVFDNDTENKDDVLSHSDIEAIFSDAKRYGSLKDSVLAHGIDQIDYLFPRQRLSIRPLSSLREILDGYPRL